MRFVSLILVSVVLGQSVSAENLSVGETEVIDGVRITRLPDAEGTNYAQLMRDGFSVIGSHFLGEDFLILVARGERSYLCTMTVMKKDGAYSGGPWNDYRTCERLSGRPDYKFDVATDDLEPAE